jgi:uncharacterized protein YcaQ
MMEWTKQQAREYYLNYHFINSNYASSIEEVIKRLQLIQYDPLNVVGTNSELMLQARLQSFKQEDLYNALYKDRYLIDGWDRQMSIYHIDDYPMFKEVRNKRADLDRKNAIKYLKIDPEDYTKDVLSILKENGPTLSKDIKIGTPSTGMWGSQKPSTLALNYLFHKGVIGVYDRHNTQKKYDLIERLVPHHNAPFRYETMDDFLEAYLLRRINACGLVWERPTVYYGMYNSTKQQRYKLMKRLLDKGLVQEVQIEGIRDRFFVPTDALDIPITIHDRISFLAPLDNAIWDRDLLQELFDFYYVWEVYTPKAKRQFGYYVLPIVRGTRFIGRIEFDTQRDNGPLKIISIQYEKGIRKSKTLERKLDQALQRFASYLTATTILYPTK